MNTSPAQFDEAEVAASPEEIWAWLANSQAMLRWAPMIVATTGGVQSAGAERSCTVEWKGKRDEVSERCVECDPTRRIAWIQTRGGMTGLYHEFRFGFSLFPVGPHKTRLRMEHSARPRHALAWLFERLLLRRMLRGLRRSILHELKCLAERESAPGKVAAARSA